MKLAIPDPALVLLVGPSGSGKSTFAKAHFGPTEVVSSDELRGRVADDSNDQAASAEAFRILALLVNGRLKRRLTAVVDATNLRPRSRRPLAAMAHRYSVPVVVVAFDFGDRAYFDHNRTRPDRQVDDDVIDRQLELMDQALADLPREGYAAVHVLREPAAIGAVSLQRTG